MNPELIPLKKNEDKKKPPLLTDGEINKMEKERETKKYISIMPDGSIANANSREEMAEIKEAWDSK